MSQHPASSRTVGIVGVGYMGIATALAFAHRGPRVYAYDLDPRVRSALRAGHSPYREDGLEELLRTETRRGRLVVVDTVTELAAAARCIFLCVPTPAGRSGRIDLTPLRSAVRRVGSALKTVHGYRLVVVKSTVVPGTTESVVEPLLRRTSGRAATSLGIAVNPEFLSEGRMVQDALFPERIVLGVTDARSFQGLRSAYKGFPAPVLRLSPSGAELVKYGSNAFLALKVSFANEISRWTEVLGTNVDDVVTALGADPRIGPSFLKAGPGFGGSCFEKDLRAFVARAEDLGVRARAAEAALAINREQTDHASELIGAAGGTLRGKTVAVLGLAFKAGTDDVRESRAFPIVERLLRDGARVRLHDPAALRNFRREWDRRFGSSHRHLRFCPSVPGSLRGADLAVVQADWSDYLAWPTRWSRSMRRPLVVDLRRALPPSVRGRSGLRVVALGVGSPSPSASRTSPKRPSPRQA